MLTVSDAGTALFEVLRCVQSSRGALKQASLTASSLQVKLICGTSNALVSVWEPEKCEYQFTVATPAVCFDGLLEQAEAKQKGEVVKDEL